MCVCVSVCVSLCVCVCLCVSVCESVCVTAKAHYSFRTRFKYADHTHACYQCLTVSRVCSVRH